MECLYFVSTWGRKSNISKREMIKGKCETNKRFIDLTVKKIQEHPDRYSKNYCNKVF